MSKVTITKCASVNVSASTKDAVAALFEGASCLSCGVDTVVLDFDESRDDGDGLFASLVELLSSESVDITTDQFADVTMLSLY